MEPDEMPCPTRRRLLQAGALALLAAAPGARAALQYEPERELAFLNLHTGERLRTVYWQRGHYLAEGLDAIRTVLRDHRANTSHEIDPLLLDVLHRLQARVGNQRPLEVISGYRSPLTNAMLNAHSSGVSKQSLHLVGKAIDIRLPGTDLARLHTAACTLKGGGVGLYRSENFIHVDTGRVRYW